MTDNERIQGLTELIERWKMECYRRDIQIEQRDKTIAELRAMYTESVGLLQVLRDPQIDETGTKWIDDMLARHKALTVSKQEESTVSEVACEQTNKDSLHVARQNNPTHHTQQINRLAAEVAADMRWREGEPM